MCPFCYQTGGSLLRCLSTLTCTWYRRFIAVALALESPPPDVIRHPALRSPDFPRLRPFGACIRDCLSYLTLQAVYFCCTGLGVTSTGRYPASCPAKPGLSSSAAFRRMHPRLSVLLNTVLHYTMSDSECQTPVLLSESLGFCFYILLYTVRFRRMHPRLSVLLNTVLHYTMSDSECQTPVLLSESLGFCFYILLYTVREKACQTLHRIPRNASGTHFSCLYDA